MMLALGIHEICWSVGTVDSVYVAQMSNMFVMAMT